MKKLTNILLSLISIGIIFIETIQLNYSAMPSLRILIQQGFVILLVNTLVVAGLNLTLVLLLGKWKTTLIITSILSTLWSIANYYVIEFHGSPLFFSEFANFRTAMTVAGGYRFEIDKIVLRLVLLFAAETAAIIVFHIIEKKKTVSPKKQRWLFQLTALSADIGLLFIALFSPYAVKPSDTMGWTWVTGVEKYGYVNCIIEDIQRSKADFKKPDGYDPKKISLKVAEKSIVCNDCPDFILILNESFCDLSVYSEIDSDYDCFGYFYQIENAAIGYTFSPCIGGGTNDSEFELLTSNSMYLVSRSAPFNFVKLDTTGNNIIQNCEDLGYITMGMHCGIPSNYARNNAYSKLGFDTILLGEESFHYYGEYGRRPWLDADNYRDLIDLYTLEETEPKFMYLLTFQNHGGYEKNDPDYDRVHTKHDFGSLSDDIDEYLTSIKMSVDAFIELTEYYSKVDRHVVICMVGDHAPSFINELPAKKLFSAKEEELAKRSVPYIIWANYEVEFPNYIDYTSMVDLVPMMLKTANMPLTSYYQYILDMHDVVPVRTSNGIWMDRKGNIGTYGDGGPYDDILSQYYNMEYNALKDGSEYMKECFEYK